MTHVAAKAQLDYLIHEARFVASLDPLSMSPSAVSSHIKRLGTAVHDYEATNGSAEREYDPPYCTTCGRPITDDWRYVSKDGMEQSHLTCLPMGAAVPDPERDDRTMYKCLRCPWHDFRPQGFTTSDGSWRCPQCGEFYDCSRDDVGAEHPNLSWCEYHYVYEPDGGECIQHAADKDQASAGSAGEAVARNLAEAVRHYLAVGDILSPDAYRRQERVRSALDAWTAPTSQ